MSDHMVEDSSVRFSWLAPAGFLSVLIPSIKQL